MVGSAGFRAPVAGALVVLAWLLASASLAAAPAEQTFSLEYSVPAGCPARATFVASVAARAPGSREVSDNAALAFDVRLGADGEQTSGTLSVRFAQGEHFEREVPTAPCADVATSMAIMAGLLLSGALLPEPPAPPPEPAPSAEAPPRAEPILAPVAVSPPPPPPPAAQAQSSRPARFRPGVFVDGVMPLGGLPFPALGFRVGLEAALERASVLSPSLRAGFMHLGATTSSPPAGSGVFTLNALDVRGCPVRFELAAPVSLHPCALLEWGTLDVAGRSTTNPTSRSMSWVGLGAAGRLEAALGRVVAVEAEAGLAGLLHHDSFVLEPGDVEVYDIPAISGRLSVGLVARLP